MTNEKNYMYKSWWKILSVLLLVYTFTGGLLMKVPELPALDETIRNLYFHVCMWFSMMILFTISVVHAVRYLRTLDPKYDIYSRQFVVVGIVFGILGYATGSIWMSYTWADPNKPEYSFSAIAREPKLIGAAIALLIYFAYLILRDSITDMDKRARISAVYNIFAYAMLAEAALSFLGVGIQPPIASWGNIIAEGRDYATEAWWVMLFPGIAISLAALSLNLLGDALGDILDPRQKGSD